MSDTFIPPADPKAGYLAHKEEIDRVVQEVLESGYYILGPQVRAFEEEFAAFLQTGYALGLGSGTEALEIALRSCGIGPGDRVLTVSHTAVATVAAIESLGAIPMFVDIEPGSLTMDPNRLEETLKKLDAAKEPRPKAVIPVHIYGLPADLKSILAIAGEYELQVIEDCAQSHGALYRDKPTGSWGHMAAFSFYPTKNLGALGDGGAISTNDPELAERARLVREYGWKERYISSLAGVNSRLDEVQAAILRVKLPALEYENQNRRKIAQLYEKGLSHTSLRLPLRIPDSTHVFHQYVIRTENRDTLQQFLHDHGIGTLIHYPVPVHLQPAYLGRIPPVLPLENTEAAAREILSLPMHPYLPVESVHRTVETIHAWLAKKR